MEAAQERHIRDDYDAFRTWFDVMRMTDQMRRDGETDEQFRERIRKLTGL